MRYIARSCAAFSFLVHISLCHSAAHLSWTPLRPLPLPRQEHTTVFLPPSTIAVLGGIIPTNDTGPLPITTTSLTQLYSIPHNSWTESAPMPLAMNHVNVAVVAGKIHVLGGLAESSSGDPAWRAVPDSFVYSPSVNTWEKTPRLPEGEERGSAAVGVHGSTIFLAGGMTDLELSGNRSQNTVSLVSAFDTQRKQWIEIPLKARYMPEARDHAGAAVVAGKMYVLGGRERGQQNIRDTVFVLDLCDLEKGWKVKRARMPTPRGGVAAGVVGEKVYIFGGEGNENAETGVFDQVEVYDTRRDQWESAGTMRIARHGTYGVGVGKKVYVPGGGVRQSGAPVADFDVFVA